MTIDLSRLKDPFPPNMISWRIGATNREKTKGLPLAYIDARDVQDRLDQVCGVENWQVRHPWADGRKLACEIGIRINGEWIWKGDGAGDSDVEAEKGAFSDSFKRAAVRWGVGRYLYDIQANWIDLDEKKGIPKSEYARLEALLVRQTPKAEPTPEQRAEAWAMKFAERVHEFTDLSALNAYIEKQKAGLDSCSIHKQWHDYAMNAIQARRGIISKQKAA